MTALPISQNIVVKSKHVNIFQCLMNRENIQFIRQTSNHSLILQIRTESGTSSVTETRIFRLFRLMKIPCILLRPITRSRLTLLLNSSIFSRTYLHRKRLHLITRLMLLLCLIPTQCRIKTMYIQSITSEVQPKQQKRYYQILVKCSVFRRH